MNSGPVIISTRPGLSFPVLLIPAFLFFVFTTCTGPKNENADKSVFTYNELNGLGSLDPASASNFENIAPVNQIFNGLVQLDDELEVQPCIASAYQISENGKVYEFQIRTDVYFHDDPCFPDNKGRKVNANDFVFSFNRLFDSKVSSAGSLLDVIDRGEETAYRGFEAINDSVFRIYLKQPFSAFLKVLSMKYFSVVPSEAIDLYDRDFRKHPVGTGPFQFVSWQEGNKLILHKNNNYFERDAKGERLPYLDAVSVSFIRDRETAFMELVNGKFDLISGADAFNTGEVLDKDGNLNEFYKDKFVLQRGTFLKTDYIGILVDEDMPLVKSSPLRLKKVRQAINYGFDRQKMIRFLRNNLGIAAERGFIPPGLKNYNDTSLKGYTYDPDKAAGLLKEAGFPGGKGLPALTLHSTENYKEQLEFIQSQLAENNIPVQINVEKPSVLRQAVNRCEYLLFKKSWVADYADEENFMGLFYSKNFCPDGVNFFHFSNATFDTLFAASLSEKDPLKKSELYLHMNQIIIDEAPVVTLYYDEVVRLVNKNVEGLTTNPMNLLNLKSVRKTRLVQN